MARPRPPLPSVPAIDAIDSTVTVSVYPAPVGVDLAAGDDHGSGAAGDVAAVDPAVPALDSVVGTPETGPAADGGDDPAPAAAPASAVTAQPVPVPSTPIRPTLGPDFVNALVQSLDQHLADTQGDVVEAVGTGPAAYSAAIGDPSSDPSDRPSFILSNPPTPSDDPFAEEEPDTRAFLHQIQDLPFGRLAGEAGTGKSYLARRYAELSPDGMLIATTGIAAVNIGGTTINSALRYFDTASMQLEYEFGRLGAALGQLADAGVTRLIVDEISMMDGRQLDILALALDQTNERRAGRNLPAIGVWLTGDFAQLPPVGINERKKPLKPGEKPPDPPIYAFQAEHWKRWADNTIRLTTIRRQADADFIAAIQKVRTGDKSAVDYFRPMISMVEDPHFEGTTILAKNDEVDRYNSVRMLQIKTPPDYFKAIRKGDPKDYPSEWKNIPDTLVLKPGCLVMILANRKYMDSQDLMYANGDLGIYLEKINDSFCKVRLQRNGQEVNVCMTGRERLKPGTPRTIRRRDEIPPEYILASIDYMPLRVAYASTVHKSQGLSLDAIQVMINSQFWMSSGMLYVGLSRARTPQGIKIVGTVDQFAARVRANQAVQSWL